MDFLGSLVSIHDRNTLEVLIRRVARDGIKAIELGSYTGYSSVTIGSVVKEYGGQMWCVDRWIPYPDGDPVLDPVYNSQDVLQVFNDNIAEAGLSDIVTPIQLTTDEALQHIIHNTNAQPVDFIFIDADHKYHAVAQDIANWWPLVASGGIMCGHDYDKNDLYKPENVEKYCEIDFIDLMHYGVIRAVDEYFGDKAQFLPERMWYVIKE